MTEPVTQPTSCTSGEIREMYLRSIEARAERGERITHSERCDLWAAATLKALDIIDSHVRAGKLSRAFRDVLAEVVAASLGAAARADKLEDRIAAIERRAKPKVRVKAPGVSR